MRKYLSSSILLVVFLMVAGNPALAAPPDRPTSGIENLLRGTQHEHLLSDSTNMLKGEPPDLNFGNYFDNSNPGWGFDIQRLGNLVFAVWFTYNPDGTPTWYIIVGPLAGKDVGFTGDIESYKWDPFGVPGNQASVTIVGTMTIAWSDLSNATATWTLDGVPGSAEVSYAEFAEGPAYANMTGHYFNAFASGWGFTLLTQGDVTVLTMYWYSGGQPVWAQGVSTTLGFNQLFDLLYFNGPGLCPSCLPRKGAGGFTTEPLETLQVNWAPSFSYPGNDDTGVPLVNIQRLSPVFKGGGPLGPNPFEDIPLGFAPVTTQGATSAYGEGFEADYGWFIGPGKGGECHEFQYDPGMLLFPRAVTGLQTGYLRLEPDDEGILPAFIDGACVNPITINAFGGDPIPIGIRMGPIGDDGAGITWEASIAAPVAAKHEPGKGAELSAAAAARREAMQGSKGTQAIYGYGATAAGLVLFDGGMSFFPFPPFLEPPSSDSITKTPLDDATLVIPMP